MLQSILREGHQAMVTLRDGDQGKSYREKASTFANKLFAEGCVLFKNLWFHDENATEEKQLKSSTSGTTRCVR